MCVQEKIELSTMSQTQRLNSTKILGDLSLAAKTKQQKIAKEFPGVAKSWHPVAKGSLATP